MPTINIPPRLRFALYLLGAVGSIAVVYAMDKGWAGGAEYKAWTNFAGLLAVLAAAKTSVSDTGAVVPGTVEQTTTTTTEITPEEGGHSDIVTALLIVILVVVLISLLGGLR